MKAIWNDVVIAESNDTIVVEGNQYFPPSSIIKKYFDKTTTVTICPWKGQASYFTVSVNGKTNRDAAWFYSNPSSAAESIKGYVAFWKGIKVTK